MAKLPRPPIPLEVKCRVAMRQLGENEQMLPIYKEQRSLGTYLNWMLARLSTALGSDQLHLDHDPPLAARTKIMSRGIVIAYSPDANDPDHLVYRTKQAHHIKTNIRGDGAQYPDRVLIKRERRRNRAEAGQTRKPAKIKGLSFQQQQCWLRLACDCDPWNRKGCPNYVGGKK